MNNLTAVCSFLLATVKTKSKRPLIIAVDGRCASGKSSLSELLLKEGYSVIHADHFFPRPEQRTADRLASPGGNFDRERFLAEVLLPLSDNNLHSYRPFSCATQSLGLPIVVPKSDFYVIEGSYCCHPELRPYYDITVFLSVSPDVQLKRLAARNSEALPAFREKWIPREELYFSAFDIAKQCDFYFET